MPRKLSTADWVIRAQVKHNNIYTYESVQYTNAHAPVMITCPTHGTFTMRPNDHLNGQGCRECGIKRRNRLNTYDTNEFIARAKAKHGTTYKYDLVQYEGFDKHVTIICPTHGPFNQRPNRHLFGDGCPQCARDRAIFNGYTVEYFNRYPDEKEALATLYIIQFSSPHETFIKIGITKQSITDRFHYGYSMFDMVVLAEKRMPLFDAYTTEQQLLCDLKCHQHIPTVKFGGYTECVVDNELVMQTINPYLDTT